MARRRPASSDTDVGGDDDLYGADEGHDLIWHLDHQDRQDRQDTDPGPRPARGQGVHQACSCPSAFFSGQHRPHSLAQARTASSGSPTRCRRRWPPSTRSPSSSSCTRWAAATCTPPSRIDRDGIIWFTIVTSNELGRFDPKTEQFTITPAGTGFWSGVSHCFRSSRRSPPGSPDGPGAGREPCQWAFQGRSAFPFPGIDINRWTARSGTPWLNAHKIGRLDPKTSQVTEFDHAVQGPRRLR